jgi:hypothetical protein
MEAISALQKKGLLFGTARQGNPAAELVALTEVELGIGVVALGRAFPFDDRAAVVQRS